MNPCFIFIRRLKLLFLILIYLVGCGNSTKEELYANGMEQIGRNNPTGAIVYFKSALEKDSNYLDAHLQLAKSYFILGKFELAGKEYEKVLKLNPGCDEATLQSIKTYIALKRIDAAKNVAREYVNSNPEDPVALEAIGITCLLSLKANLAEKHLRQSIKMDPSRVSPKVELASLYLALGKIADARQLLDEVIDSDPNNTRARYLLAELEKASGDSDRAIMHYKEISRINKSDSMSLYHLGTLYLERNDLIQAKAMSALLNYDFQNRQESFLLMSVISMAEGKYDEAVTTLYKAIQIKPTKETFYYLGLCYFKTGDLELSISQFRKVIDMDSSAQNARFFMALILLKQQRIDDSIFEIKRIIDENPQHAMARNVLGSCYLAKGLYNEGIEELNLALDLDSNLVDAHFKKGIFHVLSGQLGKAENDFQSAVAVAPELLNSRLILTAYYLRTGEDAKAMSLLQDGIKGQSADAVLYNNMAAIVLKNGYQDEGLKYLYLAKAADPDYLAAYFNIATLLEAKGDYEKALIELDEVLKKDPGNVDAILGTATICELQGHDRLAEKYYSNALRIKNISVYLSYAGYLLNKHQHARAIEILDESIRMLPGNVQALEMKSRILLTQQQYPDAIKVFSDIESLNPELGLKYKVETYVFINDPDSAFELTNRFTVLKPNSAYGYMMQAFIHNGQGETDKAISAIRRGISVDPDNLEALLMLGDIYAEQNNIKSAYDSYEQALKKKSDYIPAMIAKGMLLEKAGKSKEAISKYRQVLGLSYDSAIALNNLAYLYINDSANLNLSEGLRLAFAGFRLEPRNPWIMDTLGYALLKNGRNDDAQKVLEKTSAFLPGNPTVQYHLALARKANGRSDLAVVSLQKALSLGAFPEADNARTLLREMRN